MLRRPGNFTLATIRWLPLGLINLTTVTSEIRAQNPRYQNLCAARVQAGLAFFGSNWRCNSCEQWLLDLLLKCSANSLFGGALTM